jgi:anti-anti-sigma regulatory factor
VNSAEPIRFQGRCDIRSAAANRTTFVDAFRDREQIDIDTDFVEQVDITFIQLLVSAARTAAASGKRMRLVGVSDPLRVALARAGLRLSPSDDQIVGV